MKPKSFKKLIYSLIWTGIFLLSSVIIVKGSNLLGKNLEEKAAAWSSNLLKKGSVCTLNRSSPFLFYSKEVINKPEKSAAEKFMSTWGLFSYLEAAAVPNTILEYDNDALDISSMIDDSKEEEGEGKKTELHIEGYNEGEKTNLTKEDSAANSKVAKRLEEIKKSKDVSMLLKYLYTVDSTTAVDKSLFHVDKMLKRDFTIPESDKPQILIFHTHGASESFCDSKKGKTEDSIIGVGAKLKETLEKQYGYKVIHDKTPYDRINGKIDRNKAYNKSLDGVTKILKKNPNIEVIIDLHRDGVGNKSKRVTTINGKPTAQFMLFNGLSRNRSGPITYLANPNLEGNLAFSLQVKWKAMELYPDLTISNYLKGYRYNMHLRERYLLIELGNQNNTVEEAKNAMEPLAEVLNEVVRK